MKSIKKILILSVIIILNGCVDLVQTPQSFITEEDFIQIPQSIELVNKSVDGLYYDLWSGNYGFNCRLMRVNTGADDLTTSPKPNNPMFYIIELNPSPSANEADSKELWKAYWSVITNANKIINGTPIPENSDKEKLYKQSIAEAYFMRALAYFHLVRLFGEAPIIKSDKEAEASSERQSVASIYEEIIVPDALKAIEDLPETSRSGDSSTPSLWAGKALLADVYLTMAGWPLKKGKPYYKKAADLSLEIIEKSGLYLTPHYGDLWKEERKRDANEHMFALHHSAKYRNPSQYGKSFYPRDHKPIGGWADYYANPEFMKKYPEGERKDFNYMTSWKTENGITQWQNSKDGLPCIAKYQDYNEGPPAKSAQSNGLTVLYRYADVLLMYAESSNLSEKSVGAKALAALQEVQKRAKSSIITTTTDSEKFDDAVFSERGWEFLAEHKRWYDLVRREKLSEVKPNYYAKSIYRANNHYYFPLPVDEIQMTGWSNNPGY